MGITIQGYYLYCPQMSFIGAPLLAGVVIQGASVIVPASA
jgi:hypothetical protein